jgi:SAM-dependent methyltransferase
MTSSAISLQSLEFGPAPRTAARPPAPTVVPETHNPSRRRYITDYDGTDLELFVCTELLGLPSLHYGYWEPDEELTLDNARIAQRRYTEVLADRIPDGVHTVLDVGCGTGDLSRLLARRGYRVTALSPDDNARGFFQTAVPNLTFVQSRFEDFRTRQRFDLIVMSESNNYFDPDAGLGQCRRLLHTGGYLLISGMFRRRPSETYKQVINIEDDYVRRAWRHGLALHDRRDITRETLPTLVLTRMAIQRYVPPLVETARHFIEGTSPWKARALQLVFGRQLRELKRVHDYYLERTDATRFVHDVRYLQVLLRKEAGPVSSVA